MSDRIVNQPSSAKYRENWERIWGKREQSRSSMTEREAIAAIRRVFANGGDGEDIDVDIRQSIWTHKVRVSRTGGPIPMAYAQLMGLAKIFRTDEFTIGGTHDHNGCDTCDFGDEYAYEFTVANTDWLA